MSTYFDVLNHIENEIPRGAVFMAQDLLHVTARHNVDQLLTFCARIGRIHRVARGVYFRPHRRDGSVRPSLDDIIQVRAEAKGETLQTHGADAARRFGIVTPPPPTPSYYTSGRSRVLTIQSRRVRFRHVPGAILAFPGTPAGDALATFHHLGPGVVPEVEAQLAAEDRQRLHRTMTRLPDRIATAWHATSRSGNGTRRLRVASRPASL